MEKYYVAAINAVNLLGAQRTRRLVEFFEGAEKAWKAAPEQLKQILSPKAFESFLEFRQKNPNAPEKLVEFCDAHKINLCSISDNDYPPLLKEISSPPPVFYYRGKLDPLAERIAIVGTRHSTIYGERVVKDISSELARAGFTIVSGAAFGIDTYAHYGALKTGRTVAVLGYGITQIYSRETQKMLDEIAERGLVMTELAPSIKPSSITFPPRNRIIAGLSRGVIVIEAGKKSGALITSTYAGEFGRDVFAVPGSVFSKLSEGCHDLIRDGVILIKNARDVLDYYNLASENSLIDSPPVELTAVEKKIFDLIPAGDYITLDEILNEIDELEPSEISEIIVNLELKNCVVDNAGGYSRA